LLQLRKNQESCKAIESPCKEDCECCEQDKEVRCEKRNRPLGYRCYISVGLGGECDYDHQCRTQKCLNGYCVPHFTHGPKVPICSLTKDYVSAIPIIGSIQKNVCRCDEPSKPAIEDAEKALDGNDSTIYINKWAIDGGIEIQPNYNEGLHSFKVCNSIDCPECDPTCYKIEGSCDFKNSTYETIQEGPLSLPVERNQCVSVRMNGKPLYKSYKITFPCQRGTCRDSCKGDCSAAPMSNPKTGPCDHYVDDGVNNIGGMMLLSKEYDSKYDRTIFSYNIDNIDLNHIRLAWKGDCLIDCYYVYKEVNGKYELQFDDKHNFRACGNNFVAREGYEDPVLCMRGLQIKTGHGYDSGSYIVKVFVRGNVGDTILPYGMFGGKGKGEVEYGKVTSPMCPDVMCPATCPLKLSEISLYTQECDS